MRDMVVSAADNCWPVHMYSGMGIRSEKWPWPQGGVWTSAYLDSQ